MSSSDNIEGIREIASDIFKITSNIEPKENYFFESIWPMTNGVSINSYVVKGDKIALIDSVVDEEKAFSFYKSALDSVGIDFKNVDYYVLNHLEGDHSGSVKNAIEINPNIKIVCTIKAVNLLASFFNIASDKIIVVNTGDEIDLGNGKVLLFTETPNVHWPETMMTFEKSTGTLFSCDGFGGFGMVPNNRIFDDEQNDEQMALLDKEVDRYYANVIILFSAFVLKAITAISSLSIKMVCPSHGLVWRKDPNYIIEKYRKLASYSSTGGENEICIIWGSMYGNTTRVVDEVKKYLDEKKVVYHDMHLPYNHVSEVLANAHRSKGLVLAMPTYEYKIFPPVMQAILYLQYKKIHHKKVFRFGSYGWIGGIDKELFEVSRIMDWAILPMVEWAGRSDDKVIESTKASIDKLIEEINK